MKKKFLLKDRVLIIAGNYKNKIGILEKKILDKDMVLLSGVGKVIKHIKPNRYNCKGTIKIMYLPIHISNIKKI